MARLSDLQVASLLEEIACAMRVGTPLIDSMRRLASRRLGRVAQVAHELADGLERGESPDSVVEKLRSPVASQAASALRVASASGDPGLVDRLAEQLQRRSESNSVSRLLWFYPVLLLAVGYVVAVRAMAPLILQFNGPDITWSPLVVDAATWLQANAWIPPLVAIVLLASGYFWLFSGSRFPRETRLSLFCDALADQFQYGVTEDRAITAAAQMSGNRQLMRLSQPSLQSPPVARILSVETSATRASAVGTSPQQALVAKLRYLASVHSERARRHRFVWTRVLPQFAMVSVGLLLTLSAIWWVIAPVYSEVGKW